ncbi:MAG: NAD(P)-dependent oxidoreductase [Polyangiaceae bacterium]
MSTTHLSSLAQQRVLITGASGFIGGHLAHRIAAETSAIVTGVGRKFEDPAKLRAASINIAVADLRDQSAMAKLVSNADVIFHCAAWLPRGRGGDAEAHDANVLCTERLVRLAADSGVKRFVHLSTISAYGLPRTDDISEEIPVDPRQSDLYGRTKALGELSAREIAARRGLPLTVVRPAMVYGPRSAGWTITMLKMVQKGLPVIFGDGLGHAHPVYIDNLVDLMLLAATRNEAVGQAYNGCDTSMPWHQFFGFYSDMCGKPIRTLPMPPARLLAVANEKLHLGLPLTADRLEVYVRCMRFPVAKAERELGFTRKVSIDEGMRRSEEWLRANGYLSH